MIEVRLGEEFDGGIGPASEDPRLRRMKLAVERADVMAVCVAVEDLHWNDGRILKQVTEINLNKL